MDADRRRFLQLLGAGAGALLLPSWLSRARAQDHPPGTPPEPTSTLTLAALSAQYRTAQRNGKPLLVVVAPEQGGVDIATPFGALVFAGPAQALADLALAEVVCAKLADVRQLVPQTPAGNFTLVVVETDRVPAVARGIVVGLEPPATPPGRHTRDARDEFGRERIEARFDFQIAALAQAVHELLAPSHDVLVQRAVLARRQLDAPTLARVDALVAHGPPPPSPPGAQPDPTLMALTDRGAAVVALAAADATPAVATQLTAVLAAAAHARLAERDVPGSVWGTSEGCGPCGMGYVSARAAHFLHFLAEPGYRSMF